MTTSPDRWAQPAPAPRTVSRETAPAGSGPAAPHEMRIPGNVSVGAGENLSGCYRFCRSGGLPAARPLRLGGGFVIVVTVTPAHARLDGRGVLVPLLAHVGGAG